MWKTLLNLTHSQLGVFMAPLIFIAAMTGLLYALTPQIEQSIYRQQLFAVHQPEQEPQALSLQVKAAQHALPDGATILAVRTPASADSTTRVLYQSAEDAVTSTAIFVNPYTLAIQGQLPVYGTSGVLPVRTFLDQLHRNLFLGEWGRLYSELAASWLGIFTLTGLLQWWLKRKTIQQASHERHTFIRWHYLTALLILPMLLFLSLTGLTWSKWAGENIAQIRHWLNSDTPSLNLQIAHVSQATAPNLHAEHHAMMQMSDAAPQKLDLNQFDQIIAIARANGLMASALQIKPSYDMHLAWKVEEMNHRHPIQVDALAVDMQQHKVIDAVHFQDFPLSAKLTRWGVDMHIGVLFGWVNQLLLVISALGILAIILLAYRAWWSYSRPIQTIQSFNENLKRLWQQRNLKPLMLLSVAMVVLYCLVPIWVVSIVLFHAVFAMLQLYQHFKRPF